MHPHRRLPVAAQRPEGGDEHPQQRREPARLGHGGHEAGDRAGRALVDVGRPQMEGHGRHLEPEAHQQQGHAGQEQPVVQQDVARQVVGDLGQVGRPRGPVDEGDRRRGRRPRRTTPRTKYLSAASPDSLRRAFMAASTYRAMDRISRPRKMTMRSLASPMIIAPEAEDSSMSAWNSGPDRLLAPHPAVGHQGGHDHRARHQHGR